MSSMIQNGLADAGAAEETNLSAFGIRREQVDDLDAGFENLRFRRLLGIRRRRRMDRAQRIALDGARLINGLADHIDDAPERRLADRHGNRGAGIGHLLAAHEPFGNVHRNAAHRGSAEVLRDFENKAVAAIRRFECVQDFRQMLLELDVDDGADDLRDPPGRPVAHRRRRAGSVRHGEFSHRYLKLPC